MRITDRLESRYWVEQQPMHLSETSSDDVERHPISLRMTPPYPSTVQLFTLLSLLAFFSQVRILAHMVYLNHALFSLFVMTSDSVGSIFEAHGRGQRKGGYISTEGLGERCVFVFYLVHPGRWLECAHICPALIGGGG